MLSFARNPRERLIIFAGLFTLLIVGTYFTVSQIELYSYLQEEIEITAIKTAEGEQFIKSLGKEKNKLEKAIHELNDTEPFFLEEMSHGEVLEQLAVAASDQEVSVVNIEPLGVIIEQYYSVILVTLAVRGSYDRVVRYLSGIENGEIIASLTTIKTLTLGENADTDEVIADLSLEIYLRR